jgi:phosphatidylinositol alpha 1,6-mannosyltransferase
MTPNTGGPTDLVKHGWTGFLIDTSNSYSLNHSINQILHSAEHRLMSERARDSVIHRSWELVNSQLVSHYEDLVLRQTQQSEKVA